MVLLANPADAEPALVRRTRLVLVALAFDCTTVFRSTSPVWFHFTVVLEM